MHQKPTTRGLVHISGHPWVLGQATGTLDHKTHHGPDSGEATTFPHIVFSALLRVATLREDELFFAQMCIRAAHDSLARFQQFLAFS